MAGTYNSSLGQKIFATLKTFSAWILLMHILFEHERCALLGGSHVAQTMRVSAG